MQILASRVKGYRWTIAILVYFLAMGLLGPRAEAAFILERADGSMPTKGAPALVDVSGLATVPLEVLRVSRPAPARVVQPTRLPEASSGTVWDRLVQCEAGGNWGTNTGNGYHGGLQFHPNTYSSYRLPGYPQFAWQATRAQQIEVAKRVLAAQGWGAWPACSRKIGVR